MSEVKKICRCKSCGAELSADEIGLSKKLINRGTSEFFCLDCLGRAFEVDTEALQAAIVKFKKMGCTLFQTA